MHVIFDWQIIWLRKNGLNGKKYKKILNQFIYFFCSKTCRVVISIWQWYLNQVCDIYHSNKHIAEITIQSYCSVRKPSSTYKQNARG